MSPPPATNSKLADGELQDDYTDRGEYVTTHRIQSRDGVMSAYVLTLGARLHDFRHGSTSLVPRYSTVDKLNDDTSYLNAVAGRVANRIKEGRITAYPSDTFGDVQLELNDNGKHTLHGGTLSWDRRLFGVDAKSDSSISMSMLSVDGDNGFPSNVLVSVTYAFVADALADGCGSNRLVVSLTTRNVGRLATITNMTLHTYFDLTGTNASQRNSAQLYYMHAPNAQRYLPVDGDNIPTGEISPVTGTRYDFTEERQLGEHDLSGGGPFEGYDNFFVVADTVDEEDLEERHAVTLTGPPPPDSVKEDLKNGGDAGAGMRWRMIVRSNQPGFQVYTANHFGVDVSPSFESFGAVAVEPSIMVDAANNANFPTIVLSPGDSRTQVISYEVAYVADESE